MLRSEVVVAACLCGLRTPQVIERCEVGIKDLVRIRNFS